MNVTFDASRDRTGKGANSGLPSDSGRPHVPGGAMTGSWVLRWDTNHGRAPRVLHAAGDESQRAEVFETESGGFVLFDGYLFDRSDLETGSNHSDAWLVASAYDRWGDKLFDRIRGGCTLAVWDNEKERLIAGRDAMGLSPCFYRWNDGVFLMSTSIDAILTQPEVDGRFNRLVIAEYVQGYSSPHQREETFYQDVQRLLPGHVLSLGRQGLTISRYWDPLPAGFTWASQEELSLFQPTLERTVSRCLELGADSLALSGGFDSVSLAILAAEQLQGKSLLHAISLRFPNTFCDEGETQMEVARTLGMPQLLQTIEESLDGDDVVAAALALSGTSPSPVLSVWQSIYTGLLRSAAALGLQRLMMGTGGDDMFDVDLSYGADRLADFDLLGLWRFYRSCQRTSPFSALRVARVVLWGGALRPEIRRLGGSALGRVAPRGKECLQRRWQRNGLKPWVARGDGDLRAALEYRRRTPIPVELAPGEGAYVRAMRHLTQAPLLMLELDQGITWARHLGFTLLLPYFDRDLVELALRMPPEYLIAGGRAKTPLRQMVAERLPSVRMRAKKVDFTGMVHEVLRPGGRTAWHSLGGPVVLTGLGIVDPDRLDSLIEGYFTGRNDHALQTWLILSTEMWLQERSRCAARAQDKEWRCWNG